MGCDLHKKDDLKMKNTEKKIFNRKNLDENFGLSLEEIAEHQFDDVDAGVIEIELEEKIKELFKLIVPNALGMTLIDYTPEGMDEWSATYSLEDIAYDIVEKIEKEFCSYRKAAIEQARATIDERQKERQRIRERNNKKKNK